MVEIKVTKTARKPEEAVRSAKSEVNVEAQKLAENEVVYPALSENKPLMRSARVFLPRMGG